MNKCKPKILVFGGGPANMLALGIALADEFSLCTASTLKMGLTLALQSPPELVLLNATMCDMEGFGTIQQLSARAPFRDIPILVVAALNDFESEMLVLPQGAADYLTTPINVALARQRIRNLIEKERLRKTVATQRHRLNEEATARTRSEDMLRKLSAALDQSPASVVITDLNACIEYVNPRFSEVTGYSATEVVGKNPRVLQSGLTSPQSYATMWETLKNGQLWKGELVNKHKNGNIYWEESQIAPIRDAQGVATHFVAVKTDISKRKQAEDDLRLAASVFTHSREGISIADSSGFIVNVNAAFSRITGYSFDEAFGQNPRLLKSGRHDVAFYAAMWSDLNLKGYWDGEIWNRRKNGEVYPQMLTIIAVHNDQGQTRHYVSMFSDISERKQMEEQVRQLAFYDPLTKMPNRRLLDDRLGQILMACQRNARYGAVMVLDLDNFKAVNDSCGHLAGDSLLVEAAQRLTMCVRGVDTVARFGGDEFVVILGDLDTDLETSSALAGAVAEKIRVSLSEPFVLTVAQQDDNVVKLEHRCTASIGVVLFVDHATAPTDILKWADVAMYQAKDAGRNCIRFYQPPSGPGAPQTLSA